MAQQPEIDQLRYFHAMHFPGQPIPTLHKPGEQTKLDLNSNAVTDCESYETLEYYDDGTLRTLTDQQIKMFRHSEVQRLLLQRKVRKEKEQKQSRRLEREQAKAKARESNLSMHKRRHHDDPEPGLVDRLLYDEPPEVRTTSISGTATKKFLWPQLGQS